MRYVAFLDILGFGQMVKTTPLASLLGRMRNVLHSLEIAKNFGEMPGTNNSNFVHPIGLSKRVCAFSFSDTFVLCSHDNSPQSFIELLISSHVLTRHLFAHGFPVRGTITSGEAEAVAGTNHFIGKAIIRAAEIEKSQEWFGVILDPDCISPDLEAILTQQLFQTIVLKYPVPFKPNSQLQEQQFVLNWRLNLAIQKGIRSIFPQSSDQREKAKADNTLMFCRHLVATNRAYVATEDAAGNRISIPWLHRIFIGDSPPNSHPETYAPNDGY